MKHMRWICALALIAALLLALPALAEEGTGTYYQVINETKKTAPGDLHAVRCILYSA